MEQFRIVCDFGVYVSQVSPTGSRSGCTDRAEEVEDEEDQQQQEEEKLQSATLTTTQSPLR